MADLERANKLLIVSLALVCAVHAPRCLASRITVASYSWSDCGAGRARSSFTVSSVALRPEAPYRGQVEVEGSVSETITGGVLRATVFYLGFQVNG